jgi:ferredoxin
MYKNGQDKFTQSTDSKVKIKILSDKCISAATCIIYAQNTFDLDEDGIAYVKETTWDDASTVVQAARSCPTTAIIIEDMEGNQLWPVLG